MAKRRYHKKDKKAQIYKRVHNERDEQGHKVLDSLYPIAKAPIWCYTSQLSQQDAFQAHTYGNDETRFFVFNYYENIEVYDMILYKDEWYKITRVDHTDDYKGDTFIYVQNAIGAWKPNEEEIEPYTPGIW